jgi:aminomuconate-semialdehyde/2-hydroxymuconate-6-semialdehyde dehydrogenase
MPDAINYTLRRPLGVVGLVTPWNLPLYLLSWKTAPGLGMGNTIVAKPSELTPLTASALAEIIDGVGLPPGVFNLVHGTGPECGEALVGHPDVAAISFTGGTATGARVASVAAPQFKKLSLELGGKNPTLVFADCDLDAAVEGTVRAGFLNQGQICLCGSRVLVEASIQERFEEALLERVRQLKPADPAVPGTHMGALISLEHRSKVESYLQLAKEEGGTVIGGERPTMAPPLDRGAFLNPAVVLGLPHSCRIAQEEIFGPVISIHSFEDDAEAVRLANDVRYGLAASIWTQNLTRAHRVSAALESGMVWVNTWLHRDLRVPFGGLKDSGSGREGGRWSLEFFSEARNVCIHLGREIEKES